MPLRGSALRTASIGYLKRLVPVRILLRQFAAEVSRRRIDVDLALAQTPFELRIARLDVVRRIARHHDDEITLGRTRQLVNLRDRVRKAFRQPLEVVDKLRALLLVEERMILLALLAAQLAHARNAQRHNRQRRIDLQCCQRLLREKPTAHPSAPAAAGPACPTHTAGSHRHT